MDANVAVWLCAGAGLNGAQRHPTVKHSHPIGHPSIIIVFTDFWDTIGASLVGVTELL